MRWSGVMKGSSSGTASSELLTQQHTWGCRKHQTSPILWLDGMVRSYETFISCSKPTPVLSIARHAIISHVEGVGKVT